MGEKRKRLEKFKRVTLEWCGDAERAVVSTLLFKFLVFNVMWCILTTWRPFSYPELYLNATAATLVLSSPYILLRIKWLQWIVMLVLDTLFVANLMYCRTYYTAIPLDSYGLAGNLSDFMDSVWDSLRWADALYPLSTLACVWWVAAHRLGHHAVKRNLARYGAAVLILLSMTAGCTAGRGGFRKSCENMQRNSGKCLCITPTYTLFGHLYHEMLRRSGEREKQDEWDRRIREWLATRPDYKPLPDSVPCRKSLVVVICESLESWVLERTVDGIEITPRLNELLRESSTLYAPKVLTQAAGGRSIDCQLMLNAGMLPLESGCFSSQYVGNVYHTLTKALKDRYGGRGSVLTVDKYNVWNQGGVAKAFGMDTLVDYYSWNLDVVTGAHKRLADDSFFRQSVEKLSRGELWPENEPAYVQFVTCSGHSPFVLPEKLRRVSFRDIYPERVRDYMVAANYTDFAIGQLMAYLKARPDYGDMLVVITGDHEGLASEREKLCHSEGGRGLVGDKPFTPFIVVNSPVSGRYGQVMGQVDMYTTILNLMRLDDWPWKGMGQSILDSGKPPFAVGTTMDIEGDTTACPPQIIRHILEAREISDLMIRGNWFARHGLRQE